MVSVIIPALNAGHTLGFQLDALAGQREAPRFEVIVADNGSTDDTREVVKAFAAKLDVSIVDASAVRGAAFARNSAAAATRYSCLLFCDADDRVSCSWVGAMWRALKSAPMATGPVIRCGPSALAVEPTGPIRAPKSIERRFLNRVPYAATSNLGVHAAILSDLGGFDPSISPSEDADLGVRAHIRGTEIRWEQEAVVYRQERETLREVAKQAFAWGMSDVDVYAKYRQLPTLRRTGWDMLRPYLAIPTRAYLLATPRRRWWIASAAHRAGRLAGSIRRSVFCP